ncbi:MAG: hypothetical protein OES21_00535 [Myxococcales bacterium]|nr:hypothetical protein [Myxococcales bacterium]
MQVHFPRTIAIVALAMASMLTTIGCGTTGDGDPGGGAGNGGTVIPGLEGVTQCVSSAYQVVFRGLVEPLDPLLRYIDTPVLPPPALRPDAPTVPQIADEDLTEEKIRSDVYSRFTWNANDVAGVSDPDGMLITVSFEDSGGLNPVNLDYGIDNMQVAHIPWEITVGTLPTVVGKGRMSVSGLGPDTIRMGIIPREDADPPDTPEPRDVGNPWYGGVQNYCRFEVPSFQLHLDLATPGSKPTAVIVGFEAESRDYDIENGWFYFEEDDTVRFEGDAILFGNVAAPLKFNLTLDYRTDPAALSGTYGSTSLPPNCTIDLDTFKVSC